MKFSIKNCKGKGERQDSKKNLMCSRHFKEFMYNLTKHKFDKNYTIDLIDKN